MRKAIVIFAAMILASASMAGLAVAQEAEAKAPLKTKYVILMIGDGMGLNHVDAASLYKYGRTGGMVWESFPVKYAMSTYPAGGGYDAEKAQGDAGWVKKGATDSAAAATALSTGVKTYNGAIGVNEDKKPIGNVLEAAEAVGKSTGVVSSVMFAHATPAGFVAHNEDRDNYADIALEMIEKSSADVIMGGGHPLYDDDGRAKTDNTDEKQYRYVGGADEWKKIVAGKAGEATDADHNGSQDDAWTFVEKREDFQKLMTGEAPKRVLGMPRVSGTLQRDRSGLDDDMKDDRPFEAPLTGSVATLAEMTTAAINVLDGNEKGFFLMVEGGAVDWAAHSNLSGRTIEETVGFEDAVAAVVAWVDKNSNWDETLLVVTADHETGFLSTVQAAAGGEDAKGKMPLMEWKSGSHTNSLVGVWAKGSAAAGLFKKYADESDPVRGSYIDNTEVAKVIFEAMK